MLSTALSVGVSVYVILITPDMFRSTAIIMPATTSNPGINAGGLLGLVAQSSLASSSNRTKAYLDSYPLAERVYQRLKNDLLTHLYPQEWDSKTQKWAKSINPPNESGVIGMVKGSMTFVIETSYEDAISITSDWGDPHLAKKVVDAYIEELEGLLNDLDSSIAKKERGFYLEQFMETQKTLLGVQMISRNLMSSYGLKTGTSIVDVKLSEDRLLDIYNSRGSETETDSSQDVVKNVPIEVLLDYLNARKDALSVMGGQIEQQYHMRRIESKQNHLLFHVVDPPHVPLNRFKPNKKIILMMGILFGGVLGCIVALLKDIFYIEGNSITDFHLKNRFSPPSSL